MRHFKDVSVLIHWSSVSDQGPTAAQGRGWNSPFPKMDSGFPQSSSWSSTSQSWHLFSRGSPRRLGSLTRPRQMDPLLPPAPCTAPATAQLTKGVCMCVEQSPSKCRHNSHRDVVCCSFFKSKLGCDNVVAGSFSGLTSQLPEPPSLENLSLGSSEPPSVPSENASETRRNWAEHRGYETKAASVLWPASPSSSLRSAQPGLGDARKGRPWR